MCKSILNYKKDWNRSLYNTLREEQLGSCWNSLGIILGPYKLSIVGMDTKGNNWQYCPEKIVLNWLCQGTKNEEES